MIDIVQLSLVSFHRAEKLDLSTLPEADRVLLERCISALGVSFSTLQALSVARERGIDLGHPAHVFEQVLAGPGCPEHHRQAVKALLK